MEPIPRPEFCRVCREPLPQGNRGRPRTTCGDACRKRKQRNWRYDTDEFYQKTRKAWQIIKGWERRFGSLTHTYPEWPGLNLRDRLLIRLQRGWPIHFCAQCERPYMPDAPDARGRYCSKACENEDKSGWYRAKGKKSTDPVVAMRERLGAAVRRCKHCGVRFAPTSPLHRYHSHACRTAAYRKRWGNCAFCSTRFERTRSNKIYCTRRCATKDENYKKRQAYLDALPPQVCIWCGITIPPRKVGSMPRIYCKTKCSQRHFTYRKGRSKRLPRKSPLRSQLTKPALPPRY